MVKPMTDKRFKQLEEFYGKWDERCQEIRRLREENERLQGRNQQHTTEYMALREEIAYLKGRSEEPRVATPLEHHNYCSWQWDLEIKNLREENAKLRRVMKETQGIAEVFFEGLAEALRELDEE